MNNYKVQEEFSDYGLPDLVLGDTTINRLILSGNYGWIIIFMDKYFLFNTKKINMQVTIGGGWTGMTESLWRYYLGSSMVLIKIYRYYDLDALKSDINIYAKWQYEFSTYWNLFADLQYRHVQYKMNGFRRQSLAGYQSKI